MALSPSVAFTKLGHGPQTLEIFLDLLCPFSAKMTRHLNASIVPRLLDPKDPLSSSLSLLIRPYPQPWHGTSTYVCEAAVAFGLTFSGSDPATWWAYFVRLMEEQERWFDIPSKSLTSDQIRDQLSVVAGEVLEKRGVKGPNSKLVGEVRDKLALKGTPNGGTDATNDLKWFIKLGRQNAIHVTPSAVFNGIFDGSISSSWQDEEWNKYFKEKHLL